MKNRTLPPLRAAASNTILLTRLYKKLAKSLHRTMVSQLDSDQMERGDLPSFDESALTDITNRYQKRIIKEIERTQRVVARKYDANFRREFGVNPNLIFRNNDQLELEFERQIQTNVDLIKSVSEKTKDRISKAVSDNFRGKLTDQKGRKISLRDYINKSLPTMNDRRAQLIARDQISKLEAMVEQTRSKQLGVEKFLWIATIDGRERPEHRKANGKVFYYDDRDGKLAKMKLEMPGESILCRCRARPIMPETLFNSVAENTNSS